MWLNLKEFRCENEVEDMNLQRNVQAEIDYMNSFGPAISSSKADVMLGIPMNSILEYEVLK